ncbi:MAG: LamG-like jellyroll fold domain-containing protein, partial [Opitutaceae bacterium]
HHIAVIVDGGPKIISFVVDGELHDGGDRRQFGWARFPRELRTVSFGDKLVLAPRLKGEMKHVRIYDRALRTTEAIGNWRAGRQQR